MVMVMAHKVDAHPIFKEFRLPEFYNDDQMIAITMMMITCHIVFRWWHTKGIGQAGISKVVHLSGGDVND